MKNVNLRLLNELTEYKINHFDEINDFKIYLYNDEVILVNENWITDVELPVGQFIPSDTTYLYRQIQPNGEALYLRLKNQQVNADSFIFDYNNTTK